MKFPEYSKRYIPSINGAIKSLFDFKLKSVEHLFLKEYYSELSDYMLSGGKKLRPLLCIATYNAFHSNQDDTIIHPSVGVEFLHNATLIHDDIIDKDDFRRGKPSFHYRFRNYHKQYKLKKMDDVDYGNSIGIIGGDNVFIMGLEVFLFNEFKRDLNLNAIKYYEKAFIEIINGVLIETDMVNRKDLTISDYIKMISLKTGALIEKSILIGANYAEVEEKFLKDLSRYGLNLGIIFQIIDDILGTFGDENVTGKPTDGDIREGKQTCLLIAALNNLDKEGRVKLEILIENPNMTNENVEEVKDLFRDVNVIDSCKKLANSYYQEAKSSLEHLNTEIKDSEAEFFQNLLDFVMNRKF